MVKNTQGGNKSKGFARKNLVKKDTALRVSEDENEIYAQAVKVMGGSIASAIDLNGNPLRAHIRGKFRGRGKKDNFIGPGTWLLVGLHSWESDKLKSSEMRNCDILEVYNETDKNRLKNSLTFINWSKFIANDNKMISYDVEGKEDNDAGFVFGDDTTEEYEKIIASQSQKISKLKIIDENEVEISIDDL
jgi:hypothetical protein